MRAERPSASVLNLQPPLRSLDQLRSQMPVTRQCVYLDHAAVAPLPQSTAGIMQQWATDLRDYGALHWAEWRSLVERARQLAAELLHAAAGEVAVIRNTTEGIAIVAEGWQWKPGDNVVVPAGEFPSNLYPWICLRDRGVEVRTMDIPPGATDRAFVAAVQAASDQSTRIIACSLVDYATGAYRDPVRLSQLARQIGAKLFIDAIQGLGVIPMDVQEMGIDFLAADGHKWLLGPEGAGLLYVRENCLNDLRVSGPGWNSVVHAGDFGNTALQLKETAGRYEAGTYNMVGVAGLFASLYLLSQIPVEQRFAQLLEICGGFRDVCLERGLKPCLPADQQRSGILSLNSPSLEPRQLMRQLKGAGIVVNVRAGKLRISPHMYNNAEDVEIFRQTLHRPVG